VCVSRPFRKHWFHWAQQEISTTAQEDWVRTSNLWSTTRDSNIFIYKKKYWAVLITKLLVHRQRSTLVFGRRVVSISAEMQAIVTEGLHCLPQFLQDNSKIILWLGYNGSLKILSDLLLIDHHLIRHYAAWYRSCWRRRKISHMKETLLIMERSRFHKLHKHVFQHFSLEVNCIYRRIR
jgi:hypothetical protein